MDAETMVARLYWIASNGKAHPESFSSIGWFVLAIRFLNQRQIYMGSTEKISKGQLICTVL
jgi:hypothetical protein